MARLGAKPMPREEFLLRLQETRRRGLRLFDERGSRRQAAKPGE
jgi:hypothetical protein